MKIELDIDENVYKEVLFQSEHYGVPVNNIIMSMIKMGLNNSVNLMEFMDNSIRANMLLQEIHHMVFDKSKTYYGKDDSESAVEMINDLTDGALELHRKRLYGEAD